MSKEVTCSWENHYDYRGDYPFGLLGGSLLNSNGKVIATTTRSDTSVPVSNDNLVVYELYNIMLGDTHYKLKLEMEKHMNLFKGDVHLNMYDKHDLIFRTSKNGYYNEIFIEKYEECLPVLFPTFFSLYFNLTWGDL